jgi:hypothetical protein
MNSEGANQTQTQRGGQQSQSQGNRTLKPEPQKPELLARASVPGEDPDTLTGGCASRFAPGFAARSDRRPGT